MIRISICDDSGLQLDILKDLLADYSRGRSEEISVSSFTCGEELLAAVNADGPFDIYIQDLLMPGINGMEVAEVLRRMGDEGYIIFLTSTLEYAVQSFDVGAYYYMLKPLNRERMCHILDKALADIRKNNYSRTIDIKTQGKVITIPTGEIAYAELSNRAVKYHLRDERTIEGLKLRASFASEITPLLADDRFRICGAGMAINLSFVDDMDADSVLLRNGNILHPSKSACSSLRTQWLAYRKKN